MIINYIIIIIVIKKSITNILLKNEKKFLDYPKVTSFETGFEPGTSEFFTYLLIHVF